MMKIYHEKTSDELHIPMNMSKLTFNNYEEAPIITTHKTSSSNNETSILKIRSIRDLYEATNELHLVCLMAQGDNISFEEAIVDDK
jgi:glutathionylspermidine synthase